MCLGNLIKEFALFALSGIHGLGPLRLLSVQFFTRLSMLLDLHFDDGNLLVTILDHALRLRVIQEPLGQEIHRLLGLPLVHDSHALGDDLTQLLTLDIVGV